MSEILFTQKYVDKDPKYVKQYPYVDDKGIWMPVQEYAREDEFSMYRMLLSKELFIKAYNMWIKGDQNETD